MSKSQPKKVADLFSGYQVEEIMRVCVVSEATARHFKRGSRLPSPQAQRLWWLHRQGRVLGPEWKRFRVYKQALVDEAGNEYRENEIAAIPFLHQQIAALRVEVDKVRYAEAMSELGVFDFANALRKLLDDGQGLWDVVNKIPRRRAAESDSDALSPNAATGSLKYPRSS